MIDQSKAQSNVDSQLAEDLQIIRSVMECYHSCVQDGIMHLGGEYVRYAYRSLLRDMGTYLLNAVHLLKNSSPSRRGFFDHFTLHYYV